METVDKYEVVFAAYSDDPTHNYDVIDSEDNSIVIKTGFETEEAAQAFIDTLCNT